MTDPASEQSKNPPAGDPAKSKEESVPKAEYDKLHATVKSLQADLEKAKLDVLNPEYLEFVREKKDKANPPPKSSGNSDIDELRQTVKALNDKLGLVSAVIELQEVEKKYDDFDEYRADIQKILESKDISIESAYIEAKFIASQKADKDKNKEPEKKAPKSSGEKPGSGYTPPVEPPKEFKTRAEADAYTKKMMEDKYGLKGDTI